MSTSAAQRGAEAYYLSDTSALARLGRPEAALVMLHCYRDFELIAEVTGQRVEWVVPAGAVP